MDKLNEYLKKGIPNDLPLMITASDIIRLSDNPRETEYYISNLLKRQTRKLGRKIDECLDKLVFNRSFNIVTDPDTLEKHMYFDDNFCTTLINANLGVGLDGTKHGRLSDEEFDYRIHKLKNMSDNNMLVKEYPLICTSWGEVINELNAIKTFNQKQAFSPLMVNQNNMNDLLNIKIQNDFLDRYAKLPGSTAMSPRYYITINGFKDVTINILKKLREVEEEVNEEIGSVEVTSEISKFLSKDKFEMYVADQYLTMIEDEYFDNVEDEQKALYFVSTYIFENKDKINDKEKYTRVVNNVLGKYKEEVISKKNIYDRYVKVLVEKEKLYNLDFDYELFKGLKETEIEKLISKYKETLKVSWNFLDGDEDLGIPEQVRNYIKNSEGTKKDITKRDPIEVFIEKKQFFDSSEPFIKIEGKDTFNGYVGYIYDNGKVILDKFYDDVDNNKVAESEAIYVMDFSEFCEFSRLSKSNIIANRLCKRFYHRGDWQSRVSEVINKHDSDNYERKANVLSLLKNKAE